MRVKFYKLLSMLLCLVMLFGMLPTVAFAAKSVEINETNFPDEVFRTYVGYLDKNHDGTLDESELSAVITIVVSNRGIADLKGIEHFTALETLECENNNLTSLDISKNKKLMVLRCYGNKLTSLDISKCEKLVNVFKDDLGSANYIFQPTYKMYGYSSNCLAIDYGLHPTTKGNRKMVLLMGEDLVGGSVNLTSGVYKLEPNILQEITFTPKDGYRLDYIVIKGKPMAMSTHEISIIIRMNEDASVVPKFKKDPTASDTAYSLTTKVNGGHGLVSVGGNYVSGSRTAVEFTPDSGYEIDTVTVNGEEFTNENLAYNFCYLTIDSNKSLVVTYKAIDSSGTPEITKHPTAVSNLVYDGNEKALINGGEAKNGTMEYKLNNGRWSEELPKASAAGTYIIWYRVEGATGYNSLDSNDYKVEATIGRGTQSPITFTSADSTIYGTALTLSVTGGSTDGDVTYEIVSGTENATLSEDTLTPIKVGSVKVKATKAGNDQYEAVTAETEITINPKAVTASMIGDIEEFTYSGDAREPKPVITDGTVVLREGTDFEYSWSNNTNAGNEAAVTITGKGNYTGEASKNFTINPKDVTDDMIGEIVEEFIYSGNPNEPKPVITDGETELVEDTDFEYSYDNNIDAGEEAIVTITGKGNYTGEASKNFTINKADPTITITTDRYLVYGGGKLTLTVESDPPSDTNTVTSDVYGLIIKNNGDGTFTPNLPDKTYLYTFTATFAETKNYNEGTATCQVLCRASEPNTENQVNVKDAENGRVSVNPDRAIAGEKVTITVTPEDGYELDKLSVTDENGSLVKLTEQDGKYTFQMPDSKVTIKASFKKTATDTPVPPAAASIKRCYGENRIATAIEISKAGWTSADTVIIASCENYPDALAGATLSKKYDAPVLLSASGKLEQSVLNEIKRLGAKKFVILGGASAISEAVAKELENYGTVERVADANRNGTAAAIAYKLCDSSETVFLVSNTSYADALSVSTVAAITGTPVLYVNANGSVPAETKAALEKLGCKNAYIIGGTSAVSGSLEAELSALSLSSERVYGANRYLTAVEVNKRFANVFTSDDIAVATGKNYPDALAGGGYAAKNGMKIYLIDDNATAAASHIKSAGFDTLVVFGGPNAIANSTVQNLVK